ARSAPRSQAPAPRCTGSFTSGYKQRQPPPLSRAVAARGSRRQRGSFDEAMSDHALSRPGGYLREHRLRLTLWIAVVEGLLVVVHLLPKYAVYALAAIAL